MANPTPEAQPSKLKQIAGLFYITTWLPAYSLKHLRGDMFAGVTVGVMLIPQGMAYAMLAGAPPIYGLYASLVPLLVYVLLGTSRHLAVGINAIDTLIIGAGVGALAAPFTDRFLELVLLLALLVGTIQILMGAFRLGFVVSLLSRPVVTGFTAAAAITIALSQVKSLLGISIPRTPYVPELMREVAMHLQDIHVPTLAIGAAGIVLLLLLNRFVPLAPGPLIAVVLSSLAVWYFGLEADGVAIVGDIPQGLPTPRWPDFGSADVGALLPTALTLALVQFMSVISLGKVFAARHRYQVGANRELLAMGTFNVLGGMMQSLPVSGSFSRSAVSERAGGRTALSNVFAALVVAITLLFLTPLFYYLPVPTFAAIIIVAVLGMIDLKEVRFLFRAKQVDGGIAILTFLATLLIGIHQGVLVGIGASVVAIMYRISRPNVAVLGHLPDTRSFRDVRHHDEAIQYDGLLVLQMDASMSFANADYLRNFILRRVDRYEGVRAVVIDASSNNDLDTTAIDILNAVARTLKERGIALYFAGVKDAVSDVMDEGGLYEILGTSHFFLSPHRAVKHILSDWGQLEEYLDSVPEKEDPEED